MDNKMMLWIVIGVLGVVALYMTFQAGSASAGVQTVQATKAVVQSAASSGMVGGC